MIDGTIRRLLEQAIDSPIKLQLVLLFHESPALEGTARAVAERIFRDIWSTSEALRELAESGVLAELVGRDGPVYRYRPSPDLVDAIRRLEQCYNEPLERDVLQRAVREIAGDAPYRRALRVGIAYESVNL